MVEFEQMEKNRNRDLPPLKLATSLEAEIEQATPTNWRSEKSWLIRHSQCAVERPALHRKDYARLPRCDGRLGRKGRRHWCVDDSRTIALVGHRLRPKSLGTSRWQVRTIPGR